MAAAPIDLSALRRVNGRIDLQAGSFAYRQYRVTDAQFAATLDGGVLRVGTLKGRTWGGSLDASGMVDAASRRIAVKGSASGVNVNAVQRDLTGRDTVEGSGRLSLDVETAGRNTAELKSQLRGSAAVQLRDGAVKGVNLARSFRQAEAALALKQATSVPSSQTEKTDFSELSASFQIADGIARSADLDAKSPFLRVGGAGAIDIGRSSIDYTLRATVVGAPTGQDGGDLAALKGIVVPVRLTGPLDAVQWKIDWSGVAAAAVQNEIQKQLERQLGGQRPGQAASGARLEDVLKEKLFKGLFK